MTPKHIDLAHNIPNTSITIQHGQDGELHQINITPIKHLFIDVQTVRFSPDMRDYATVKIGSH